MKEKSLFSRRGQLVAALLAGILLAGCGGGGGGGGGTTPPPVTPPTPPPPETPILTVNQALPGAVVAITGMSGGTGSGGTFRAGDTLSVTFTLTKRGGGTLKLLDMNAGAIMVSGPSSNYQVVIPRQADLIARSIANTDGSYTYTFPLVLPATYQPPVNDSASFGVGDGELTGQNLAPGTYTVGIEAYKNYQVEQTVYRDSGNATFDFLYGGATTISHRELVKPENCALCHTEVRAHGNIRRDVKLCVLCHTSGSEDRNVPTVLNGTPGVSMDFRVMIHKIHNGEHLPSVLGIGTNPDGTRNYTVAPQPYEVVGFNNSVVGFSEVAFPVWPSLSFAMPRRFGYTALSAAAKLKDDTLRTGVIACDKCHGDPDGAGPVSAPAQGSTIYDAPTRRACGSCHDDVDWTKPYNENLLSMPAQADDTACLNCHSTQPGALLNTHDVHIHPMVNPVINGGLNINVTSVAEAGTNNGNGRFETGEKMAVTFTMTDDLGAPVAPAALGASISVAISGPTSNRNMVLSYSIPVAALGAGPTYALNLPEYVQLEKVGVSTAALESFVSSRTPHWNVTGALDVVQVRTATVAATTLATATKLQQNYVDVVSAAGFARNAYIVIDDGVGGSEEYLRIQYVQGNRLWFAASGTTTYQPGLRVTHSAAATVKVVTLVTKTVATDYTVNAATGTITEVTEFGAGNAVLLSYATDFVIPTTFGPTINESPDLGEDWGKWTGKAVPSGTYSVALWSYRNLVVNLNGETQTYRGPNPPAVTDVLFGSATTLQPGGIIASGEACNSCHNEVYAHGAGRRGYDECVVCHGAAGTEDRPQYVASAAQATTGLSIDFRQMLHKIHAGAELANAATYTIVGFGSAAYPNNFGLNMYSEVEFPAWPGGVANCTKCHGASNAWKAPADRDHPTQALVHAQTWLAACSSCHDGADAAAHFATKTAAGGAEACGVCHGPGADFAVDVRHMTR